MSRAALIAVVALAAAGCDGGGSPVPDHQFTAADTTITYAFTDSSVPPEHHRSFVLTIVDGVGTVVVDSYGDETARDAREVSSAVVDDVIDSYPNEGDLFGVFNPDLPDDEGCAGGQTFALTLEDASEETSTSIYRCDDASEDAALALAEAASPLLEAFDISTLTEDRYRF